MKINIVIPFLGKTGGIVVALEHARGLRALGHDVAVYYPILPYREFLFGEKSPARKWILGQLKPLLGNLARYRTRVAWAGPGSPVRPVPWIAGPFLRDADVTMATAWPTAYSVAALPRRKGAKVYFIQHYETWSSDPSRVDGSYRLPVDLVTIAPWLTELMERKFGRQVLAEVHNGIDSGRFRPPASRDWDKPSLLMMHHELEWKGAGDGLEALAAVHARHPAIPIRLFGMARDPGVPWVEYHRDPAPEALLALYQGSHIFLSPSRLEGWGLPVVEAMACGCAVVATRTGCAPVFEAGGNLMAVEPGDAAALEAAVEDLLRDPAACRDMAERGRRAATEHTWPRATRNLEQALLASTAGASAGERRT